MGLDVAPLTPEELDAAVGVLARGMRDNPLHVAAFGDDPDHRVAQLTGMFRVVVGGQPEPLRAKRFGFRTVGETPVIGVPNWFMTRTAQ